MMVPPELYAVRQELLDSFEEENGYYYSSKPYGYSNFIDGMAWVSLLAGASRLVGDTEMELKCVRYVQTIMNVGPDARSYAPMQVTESWVQSTTIDNMWYYPKAQSFAGPAALYFARNQGVNIDGTYDVSDPTSTAKLFCSLGFLFGYAVRYLSFLEQHINSMFLAYLLRDKKPASSMLWLCEDNPFFSYIAGQQLATTYPDPRRYIHGETVVRDEVVPLSKRKPSTWIFRLDPRKEYIDMSGDGYQPNAYTRIWELTAEYLQTVLGNNDNQ